MNYGGKPISALTDAVLAIAERDCAGRIEKLKAAGPPIEAGKDVRNYPAMLANVQAIADEIVAEKQRRAGS